MKNIGAKAIMEHKNETSKNESADLNNKKAIRTYGYIVAVFVVVFFIVIGISGPKLYFKVQVIQENNVIKNYENIDSKDMESIVLNEKKREEVIIFRDSLNFIRIIRSIDKDKFNIHIQYWNHKAYYDDFNNSNIMKMKNIIENYYSWNWMDIRGNLVKFYTDES